jgi:hypothetical protein
VKKPMLNSRWPLVFAIGVLVASRLGAGFIFADAWRDDPDHYRVFATNLARHRSLGFDDGNISAYRPPLYPVLLAPAVRFGPESLRTWIMALHLGSSVAIAWSVVGLLRHAGITGTFPAALAVLAVALHPNLWRHSSLIMTETLFTALLWSGIALWLRRLDADGRDETPRSSGPETTPKAPPLRTFEPAAIGILLGLAALTRPSLWPIWGAVAGVSLLMSRRPHRTGWGVFQVTLLALAVTAPWVIRNLTQLDRPILTTTHGGYTLWLGMNPSFHEHEVRSGAVWPADRQLEWQRETDRELRGLKEVERDERARELAVAWITAHPDHAMETAWHHIRSFWRPFPRDSPGLAGQLVGWVTLALFGLALLGLGTRDVGRRLLPALAVPLALTLLHAVLWSNIRMRVPAEPVLIALAVAGLTGRVRGVSRGSEPGPKVSESEP